MCKAGVAGDDAPRSHFPLLVGIPKIHGIKVGLDEKDVFVGNQVQERKGVLDVHTPISKGII
jgi:actin, other eukaryote